MASGKPTKKHIYRAVHYGLMLLSFAIILLVWQAVTASGLIQAYFLPQPVAVIQALVRLLSQQGFINDISITLFRILTGFIIAAVLGIPCGILIGLSKKAESLLEPAIDFIRYTPIPAFIPLFILWFGIGELEKIIVIAASVFFQLVLMVANDVSHTPKELIESGQTLGLSQFQVVSKIIYPFAQPQIFDDLRINLGWAWSGLMIAEIVGSTSGIGYVIIQSQRLLHTDAVIAAILTVGILGLLSDFVMKVLYEKYFPWATKR